MPGWCMIPDNVLKDDRLVANAKILYGKIIADSGRRGFCVSSNDELAEEVGVDEHLIPQYIGDLEKYKYLRNEDGGLYVTMQGDTSYEHKVKEKAKEEPSYEFSTMLLFDYWNEELRKASEYWGVPFRGRKQTDTRLKKIATRLSDGFSVEDIKAAINGCVWNEYNITNGYTDLELILRNVSKVEQYIARWDVAKRNAKKNERNEFAEYTG